MRSRKSSDSGAESDIGSDAEKVDQPSENEATFVDDALILKVDHTHAGAQYKAGTNVQELNANAAALEFMKVNGIL